MQLLPTYVRCCGMGDVVLKSQMVDIRVRAIRRWLFTAFAFSSSLLTFAAQADSLLQYEINEELSYPIGAGLDRTSPRDVFPIDAQRYAVVYGGSSMIFSYASPTATNNLGNAFSIGDQSRLSADGEGLLLARTYNIRQPSVTGVSVYTNDGEAVWSSATNIDETSYVWASDKLLRVSHTRSSCELRTLDKRTGMPYGSVLALPGGWTCKGLGIRGASIALVLAQSSDRSYRIFGVDVDSMQTKWMRSFNQGVSFCDVQYASAAEVFLGICDQQSFETLKILTESGETAWSFASDRPSPSQRQLIIPALTKLFLQQEHTITKLDRATGALEWRRRFVNALDKIVPFGDEALVAFIGSNATDTLFRGNALGFLDQSGILKWTKPLGATAHDEATVIGALALPNDHAIIVGVLDQAGGDRKLVRQQIDLANGEFEGASMPLLWPHLGAIDFLANDNSSISIGQSWTPTEGHSIQLSKRRMDNGDLIWQQRMLIGLSPQSILRKHAISGNRLLLVFERLDFEFGATSIDTDIFTFNLETGAMQFSSHNNPSLSPYNDGIGNVIAVEPNEFLLRSNYGETLDNGNGRRCGRDYFLLLESSLRRVASASNSFTNSPACDNVRSADVVQGRMLYTVEWPTLAPGAKSVAAIDLALDQKIWHQLIPSNEENEFLAVSADAVYLSEVGKMNNSYDTLRVSKLDSKRGLLKWRRELPIVTPLGARQHSTIESTQVLGTTLLILGRETVAAAPVYIGTAGPADLPLAIALNTNDGQVKWLKRFTELTQYVSFGTPKALSPSEVLLAYNSNFPTLLNGADYPQIGLLRLSLSGGETIGYHDFELGQNSSRARRNEAIQLLDTAGSTNLLLSFQQRQIGGYVPTMGLAALSRNALLQSGDTALDIISFRQLDDRRVEVELAARADSVTSLTGVSLEVMPSYQWLIEDFRCTPPFDCQQPLGQITARRVFNLPSGSSVTFRLSLLKDDYYVSPFVSAVNDKMDYVKIALSSPLAFAEQRIDNNITLINFVDAIFANGFEYDFAN
jgi:outer membrane protein assembly factor BamB